MDPARLPMTWRLYKEEAHPAPSPLVFVYLGERCWWRSLSVSALGICNLQTGMSKAYSERLFKTLWDDVCLVLFATLTSLHSLAPPHTQQLLINRGS